MKKHTVSAVAGFLAAAIALCALCAGEVLLARFMRREPLPASASETEVESRFCVVIDAGHGGIDSGAVSASGVLEKDINLAVAKKLEALCDAAGIDCVMTRSEDRLVVDDSVRERRKMHDLKNRIAIAKSEESPIFVSIHMNNFPEKRYSGLQVWYSKNDERSRSLAALIQTYARTFLDPSNSREIKRAGSSIFVLDRLDVPAVLVECGFLSNPDECERLSSDSYQTELALVIFSGILEFLADA